MRAFPGAEPISGSDGELLSAEAVEFSVLRAAKECVPFVRSEFEHRPFRVAAIAEADAAIG
jgi:hypothetical protein